MIPNFGYCFFLFSPHLHKIIVFKLTLKQCFEKSISPSDSRFISIEINGQGLSNTFFCGCFGAPAVSHCWILNRVLAVKIHFHPMLIVYFLINFFQKSRSKNVELTNYGRPHCDSPQICVNHLNFAWKAAWNWFIQ